MTLNVSSKTYLKDSPPSGGISISPAPEPSTDEDPSVYTFHVDVGICGVPSKMGVDISDGNGTGEHVDYTIKSVSV